MATYTPPLREISFVLNEVLNAPETLKGLKPYTEFDADTYSQVIEEAGKFCAEVLQPINRSGDEEGCTFHRDSRTVSTPRGYKEAWKQYVDAGWPSLDGDPAYGGQGLPKLIGTVFHEFENSANQAWTMYPGLTHGAYECLHAHGTDAQKSLYLPKLVSGQWMGTMCLTEPHCGTDLGMIKTKAVPQPDGSYKITGNKIFISSGDHDLSENIVHLVLAKLPDAPEGTKGISLFVVPKFLPKGEGETAVVGERNPIYCNGLEHKMGIHGNSTAQIGLEGATGFLVSEPNKGLNAMFVMMNGARLGVGMQSLGLTEIAYQTAVAYAKDRTQGRSLNGPKQPAKPADSIIVHADVRRMLMTARAYAEGGRALAYHAALLIDTYLHHEDATVRKDAEDIVGVLTPIIKAFLTDNGFTAVNECMQVFGGHGYIAEWGMEQHVRDARINMIYEGTNTVQSLDLLGRKVLMDGGAKLMKFGKMVGAFIEAEGVNEEMAEFINPLADLADKVQKLTMELGMKAKHNKDEVGAAAVPYLRVAGHFVFAYWFAVMAKVSQEAIAGGSTDPFYKAKLHTARFYINKLLPETAMLIRQARSGSASVMDMEEALF